LHEKAPSSPILLFCIVSGVVSNMTTYRLMAFLLSSSLGEAILMQSVPKVSGKPNERRTGRFFEVDSFFWPGCVISDEYPYKTELFGFGKCSLQPCSCQEVRPTSVVWGFAGKCDRAPGQIVDFVATFRMERDHQGEAFKYPQDIDTFPATKAELAFAQAMKTEMNKTKWNKLQIPAVEHIGIKLGEVEISLKSLRNGAGTQCRFYDKTTLEASSKSVQKSMMAWELPEHFFNSKKDTAVVAMEARAAFPIDGLFQKLGPELAHRTIGTVLVSVGQTFQLYEDANWLHCDRSSRHVLFRKSTLTRDMPGVLIIDHDAVMSLANKSSDLIVLGRRHMLGWFAITVHNTCHQDDNKTLPELDGACVENFDEMNPERAIEAHQRLEVVTEHAESETDCKGSRFLANEVVGPALLCSAGVVGCPSYDMAHWTAKLQEWAVTYYGNPFRQQSVLGSELFDQE